MGGFDQSGWNGRGERGLACQYDVDTILANLHEARRLLGGRTTVMNLDVFDFLNVIERASFYFDPPYFPRAVNRLYRQGMPPGEHQRLAASLREFPHPWVLSYDNSSAVRELYAWASMVEVPMRSSHRPGPQNWKSKVELLILPALLNGGLEECIQSHHRRNIPNAPTALSSFGVMEANNASAEPKMNSNTKKLSNAEALDSGTDQAREPSLMKSNDSHSVALTLPALEQLLTGRRKLSPDEKAKLLDQINVLRLGPLNTQAAPEALRAIADSGTFLCLGGQWSDFFERALEWTAEEGMHIKKLYEERRWAEVESPSQMSKPAPTRHNGKGSGKSNSSKPAQPEARAADTDQSGLVTKTDGTGSGDAVTGASSDQSSNANPSQPVQPSQQDSSPKELPLPNEVPVDSIAPVEVPITALEKKNAIQCREKLNEKQAKQYVERMLAEDKFPPVEAYRVKGVLCLTDGFHRLKAAQQTGQQTIWCIIREGTRTDAIRAAIQANSDHGLPRTNADKRRASTLAIETFPEYSDHQLADLCHVSHTFIAKVRKQLATDSSCEPRLGRDGKTRRMPKPSSAKGADAEQNADTAAEGSTPAISAAKEEQDADEQRTDEIAPDQGHPNHAGDSHVREDAISEASDRIAAFVQELIAGFSLPEKARVSEELRALADYITA